MGEFAIEGRRIWVPGGRGMLGSAVIRRLVGENCEIVRAERDRVDLRDQAATLDFVHSARPDAIVLCAATVGGIRANMTRPAEFIADNLAIELNVIEAAHRADVDRLIFFGSSCMYPRDAGQPIPESALMTGPLEPTNEPYAFAKLAGMSLVRSYRRQYGRSYITLVPTNLYGPGDHFLGGDGHVVAAMIDRFHRAKAEGRKADPVWGTGNARREFLYVDDAADAIVRLLRTYDEEGIINIAGGEDLSIGELAHAIARAVGYEGSIDFDASKPDGMPRKGLDASRVFALGWRPRTSFAEGVEKTYEHYRAVIARAYID